MYLIILGSTPYLSKEEIKVGDYSTNYGYKAIYICGKESKRAYKVQIDKNHNIFYLYLKKDKTYGYSTFKSYPFLQTAIENNIVPPDGDAYTIDYIVINKLNF